MQGACHTDPMQCTQMHGLGLTSPAMRRYYRVRVGSPGGKHLVTSVPARCLLGSSLQERLTAAITPDGKLMGISYDLSQVALPTYSAHLLLHTCTVHRWVHCGTC